MKDWNRVFAPLPPNYTLLNAAEGEAQLPPDIVFDLVLSQNKFGQFAIAKGIADRLHIPLVSLEHTLPHPSWGQGPVVKLRQQQGDFNVFISEYSVQAWKWGQEEAQVIHHGVDTEVFTPVQEIHRRPVLLSVVNDWINRDWCCGFYYWRDVTQGLPCFVVGDTPTLSRPASTLDELIWRYQSSLVFLSTASVSPIPTVLLEAMACGCCVVSRPNPMVAKVIQHGVNGFLVEDKSEMRGLLEQLLQEPARCQKMGAAARQTITDHFSLPRFVDEWNGLFSEVADHVLHTD